jgi:hypothetical protein
MDVLLFDEFELKDTKVIDDLDNKPVIESNG